MIWNSSAGSASQTTNRFSSDAAAGPSTPRLRHKKPAAISPNTGNRISIVDDILDTLRETGTRKLNGSARLSPMRTPMSTARFACLDRLCKQLVCSVRATECRGGGGRICISRFDVCLREAESVICPSAAHPARMTEDPLPCIRLRPAADAAHCCASRPSPPHR
ncbi:hypothetical protein UXJ26_09655 [Burkholderia multivorans]|uniref:hypothetical protein n=1 Tax=Burkholderia multivorans TaxID=87883 RepID=UPI0032C15D17